VKTKAIITGALNLIFEGIAQLKDAFPGKAFTIDGRLVGDIGEIIAAHDYDIQLYNVLQAGHDGQTSEGRRVQIKATFKDSLTFSSTPDYYLGFKLYKDGKYEEVYNGPGKAICERYSHRKGIGKTLLSFPIKELRKLSSAVKQQDRVAKRGASKSHPIGRFTTVAPILTPSGRREDIPTFEQVYDLLSCKGPGRAESSRGTIYRIEALNGNIVAFPRSGRVRIHKDCWGQDVTCRGTWAGGIYNGPYNIYDWFRENL
jgi:hypothetical protein